MDYWNGGLAFYHVNHVMDISVCAERYSYPVIIIFKMTGKLMYLPLPGSPDTVIQSIELQTALLSVLVMFYLNTDRPEDCLG